MRACQSLAVAALIGSGAAGAHAESLRCNGMSAAEGDSRLSLLYKCGPPLLAQTYCAQVFYGPSLQPVPPAFIGNAVPCQPVEDWVYDRGDGNLMATVRLRAGQIESIHYGRYPP
jgi:hypothetical protein